jgi:transcriptional regulator with XRE-family HTH domain
MWFDDMDIGARGIVRPAQGPLGRVLREARLGVLLSQEQLARAVGVSQTAVSRVELGAPSWSLFARCIDVLGGRPVVTIERVRTERELMDDLFGRPGEAA